MQTDREQLTTEIALELGRYFEKAPLVGSLSGQYRKPTTRALKEFLCELGHNRGFQVAHGSAWARMILSGSMTLSGFNLRRDI
jgi:hypothetical protein